MTGLGALTEGLRACPVQFAIYPLELVRTRLAVCPMGTYRGIWDCWGQIVRKEGWSCFYRGLTPSLVSITTVILTAQCPSLAHQGCLIACPQQESTWHACRCSDQCPACVGRSLAWICNACGVTSTQGEAGDGLMCADWDPAVCGGGHHDLRAAQGVPSGALRRHAPALGHIRRRHDVQQHRAVRLVPSRACADADAGEALCWK